VGKSFKQFCIDLGAPLNNPAWSWSAKATNGVFSVFTIWDDLVENHEYPFTTVPRVGEVRKKAGRTELLRILSESVVQAIPTYGIDCKVRDRNASPRKRASYRDEYLLDLRIRREGDLYFGRIIGQISPAAIIERSFSIGGASRNAANDIGQTDNGNDDPEYLRRMAGSYVRDARVRTQVLKRAKGVCEECNQLGFLKSDGRPYLETHHVISLSEQGADKPHNVIALCANDHRRAHYAENWAELQDKFLEKLQRYKTEK
jgi:5-methylcytosine-specific restriction enzyme A